ncbi:uncharacterized protein KQ657_003020 [Scheffersomyces spartinae]|uniref:Protein HOL1 n=1 Tax=Scheffersomyces spartinae TaxID=45513 RepID=A0A9P8AGF1_9ASCO|nr:uncharacterized protein KQ657_003020 [Scheffersomyces spartinae]KAG7191516.1 hypothetical protein KQ657_003020 [Scheffersomyces spartinae]
MKYNNELEPQKSIFIPGSINILKEEDVGESGFSGQIQRNKKGIILMPQPSSSPNDPLNWSKTRKYWHFFLMCFVTGLTAAISNDAGAAQDSLNEIYGISYDAMNTGAGVLFLFIGWSCIFLAPASSLYGRRITYLICLLAGTLGSVWFAKSRRTSDTIWSQAFVGLSEACAEAQVQQSLSDIFFQHNLGSVLTAYIMATSIGTFLGPLIAQYISDNTSFRWVGWWGAIITGATLIVFIFGCEETVFDREAAYARDNTIVTHKGEASTANVNEYSLKKESSRAQVSPYDESSSGESVDDNNRALNSSEAPKSYTDNVALITPASYLEGWGFKQYVKRFFLYFKIFTFPAVWLSGMLWGLQDAYLSFYLTTEEDYFPDAPWNYSGNAVGIMNVATLVGAVIGCLVAGILSDYHVMWMAKKKNGVYEPEYRLWLSFITLIISPVGLIMFGVGAERQWPKSVIYIGLGFIGYGWGTIGDISMSYLMESYPKIVILGMVGVSIINNSLGSIFTFVCSYWLDSSGTANTYIALAVIDFVTIACAIPTIYWGKSWRKRTTKAYLELVELGLS